MKTLDKIVKDTSKEYGTEIKYPLFATNQLTIPLLKENKENDPPIATHINLQRANSDNCNEKNDKTNIMVDDADLKIKRVRMIRKSKSEIKYDKVLLKQDSKENKREWLKKQLSVNHHYLRDLKMPLNSISHRNAMLNIKRYRLKASSCPDIYKNSMITIDEKEEVRICLSHLHYSLDRLMQFSLHNFSIT